ncbi:hypothetical protein PENSUB_2257 [Penicillium subrubescens]|uniref:Transmembrane protein n=1 Tax=Penicillium subrubescens TaxID=1316194 RepID=A0A1Q5URN5_9EURO|nr:hypothetical protein PENSUB_2257 [Penicillium subrubescens]
MGREYVVVLTGPLMFLLLTTFSFSHHRVKDHHYDHHQHCSRPRALYGPFRGSPSSTEASAIDNLAKLPPGLRVVIFLAFSFILSGGMYYFIKRQKAKPSNGIP